MPSPHGVLAASCFIMSLALQITGAAGARGAIWHLPGTELPQKDSAGQAGCSGPMRGTRGKLPATPALCLCIIDLTLALRGPLTIMEPCTRTHADPIAVV